jgi:hypothetical protein
MHAAVTDHTDDNRGRAALPAFGRHGIGDGVPAAEVAQFCHLDINPMCPTASVEAGPHATRRAVASRLPAKVPGVVSPWHVDLILLTVAID